MFKNLNAEAVGASGFQREILELALSFGFRGVDLDLVDFARQVEEDGIAKARRSLDSAKLRLGTFRVPIDWIAPDGPFKKDLEKLRTLAALAADVGCRRAITIVAPATDERPYHQNFEFHRQRLGETAAALEPLGIRLGVGFSAAKEDRHDKGFEFIRNLDTLQLLLSTVRASNVGVLIDLWDVTASGGTLDAIKKVPAAQVVAVRIADLPADAAPDVWSSESRLLPGETGAIDSAAALVHLAEIGYDGPVTPLPHPNRFKGLRREQAVKLIGQQLDLVWKAAGLNPAGKLSASVGR